MRSFERLSLRFYGHQEPVRVSLLTGLWPFMSSQLTTSDAPKSPPRSVPPAHTKCLFFRIRARFASSSTPAQRPGLEHLERRTNHAAVLPG